jgi:hypothetical protein
MIAQTSKRSPLLDRYNLEYPSMSKAKIIFLFAFKNFDSHFKTKIDLNQRKKKNQNFLKSNLDEYF